MAHPYDLNEFNEDELRSYLEDGVVPERFRTDYHYTSHSQTSAPLPKIPPEAYWSGGAMALVLVIFTWPVLLVGAIVGALGAHKFCPTKGNNKE